MLRVVLKLHTTPAIVLIHLKVIIDTATNVYIVATVTFWLPMNNNIC